MELFLRNKHRVFHSRVILDRVWSSLESPGEEAVRVHIKDLRKKFKKVGAPADLIKTVYRAGYQLNPLYSGELASENHQQSPAAQIAQLKSVNKELRETVTTLQSEQAIWFEQHQALTKAYKELEREREQLQADYDDVENRLAECKAELAQAKQHLQQQERRGRVPLDSMPTEIETCTRLNPHVNCSQPPSRLA